MLANDRRALRIVVDDQEEGADQDGLPGCQRGLLVGFSDGTRDRCVLLLERLQPGTDSGHACARGPGVAGASIAASRLDCGATLGRHASRLTASRAERQSPLRVIA